MMQNNTHSSTNRLLEVLLKRAHMWVLIILSGVSLAVPMSAQSFEAVKAEAGCIRGTVVDSSDDPIPGATIVLQGPAGDRLTGCHEGRWNIRIRQGPRRSRLSDHCDC